MNFKKGSSIRLRDTFGSRVFIYILSLSLLEGGRTQLLSVCVSEAKTLSLRGGGCVVFSSRSRRCSYDESYSSTKLLFFI